MVDLINQIKGIEEDRIGKDVVCYDEDCRILQISHRSQAQIHVSAGDMTRNSDKENASMFRPKIAVRTVWGQM